ncbi:MAG: M14 family metallopeptidase, partial [Planctomycetia bacterium]
MNAAKCFTTAVLLAVLSANGNVFGADEKAAPRKAYASPAFPAEPKVSVHWNRYHDHAALTKIVEELAKAHPDRCKFQSLGKSFEGREMWLLTVTDFKTGAPEAKPGFWIDGCIHANEIQATEVVLYTAWYLCEMAGKLEFVDRLLKERTFYLLPVLSPDSRDAHFHKANTTNWPRTGQRPFDDDKDGRVDEDGLNDLDGDGHITQMRRRDPKGRLKPHPDYPELLVPVPADQVGEYTVLGNEGIDDDQDGEVNEDGDGYYDPNRDWAWNWQPNHVQFGAHRYPFSIAENRFAADFVLKHPNIAGAQSYHNT